MATAFSGRGGWPTGGTEMKRKIYCLTVCFLCSLLMFSAGLPVQASGDLDIRFRKVDSSGFPLVISTFEVRDQDGAAVRNLAPGYIHVAENKEKLDHIRVESTRHETNVVFVLDNSLSMKKFTGEVSQDFFDIMQLLDDADRVGIVQLRGKPTVLQCLTKDKFSALEKMRYFKQYGAADLMGGLEKALAMLEARGGNRAGEIILLTDAPECGNRKLCKAQTRTFDTIGERLRVRGIRLHVIGFGEWSEDDEMLEHLVHETGGLKLVQPNPFHLRHSFTGVINSTPAHYKVSYVSPQRHSRGNPYCLMVKVDSERGSGSKRIQFIP